MNRLITIAFGICFAIALAVGVSAQQIGGGGPTGGTPCTSVANSLQFNNAGVFGCLTAITARGTGITGINFNTTTIGTGPANPFISSSGANTFTFAASAASGNGVIVGAQLGLVGGTPLVAQSQSAFAWVATNSTDPVTVDTGISRTAAGVVEINNGANVPQNGGAYRDLIARGYASGGSVPGISGCTAGTQTGGATAGTFVSGTTGVCTVVLTFAYTALTGWNCAANNRTTANLIRQSASSTTTATVTGTTVTSDIISFGCMAY